MPVVYHSIAFYIVLTKTLEPPAAQLMLKLNLNTTPCRTPLMVAAKEGNRDACEFLLKRGAHPNTSDREGQWASAVSAVFCCCSMFLSTISGVLC